MCCVLALCASGAVLALRAGAACWRCALSRFPSPPPPLCPAVQAMGARTVAVARGAPKMAALRAAGADVCIDMEHQKPQALRGLLKKAAPEGVDVVFDPVRRLRIILEPCENHF